MVVLLRWLSRIVCGSRVYTSGQDYQLILWSVSNVPQSFQGEKMTEDVEAVLQDVLCSFLPWVCYSHLLLVGDTSMVQYGSH